MCSCDGEPASVYREKTVRAAKPYRCTECNREIAVGESYEYTFLVYEGEPASYRTCAHCAATRKLIGGITGCHCVMIGGLYEEIDSAREEAWRVTGNRFLLARLRRGLGMKWTTGWNQTALVPIPARKIAT